MKIVITGSLGHVGKPLTIELLRKGHQVTVISSNQDKQNSIESLGAKAAIGTLEDVQFLSSVFEGADAVFVMIPPNFSEPDQVAYYRRLATNYKQAIQQSGVEHVVHLSSYGADLDRGTGFIVGSHNVEKILNELPVAITHLRAMHLYYNLYSFIGMIRHTGIMGANYGGHDRLVMVAPSDIATAAADSLSQSVTGKNVRYVASDERTANEVAQVLGNAIGKPDLQWVTFTNEQAQNGLEQSGMPKHTAEMLVELNAAIHSGIMFPAYDKHKPSVMGKIKLEDFAKEFAVVFQQS